jgi:FkbM family methyltransferase
MIYREKIANIKILRKLFIPILSLFDIEIKIKHDITNRLLYLKSWSHRGYWYYGQFREINEINFYKKFVNNGDTVLDVGGHIGYVSQIFENLVGKFGKVIILEPSKFNYKFLERNITKESIALNIAASNKSGTVEFYIENFGGFTNSLKKEFVSKSVIENVKSQNSKKTELLISKVEVDTIDNIVNCIGYQIDFAKIDAEGAELMVLLGMTNTLRNIKAIMIEISEDHQEIFDILEKNKFKRVNQYGDVEESNDFEFSRNYFYINSSMI